LTITKESSTEALNKGQTESKELLLAPLFSKGKEVLLSKRLHHPLKYPIHIGQGHAVVADWDTLIYKEIRAVEQLLARAHAAAALYRHCVPFRMVNGGEAGNVFKMYVLSRELLYHPWELHTTDVLAGAVVGARLQQQDRVAVLQF